LQFLITIHYKRPAALSSSLQYVLPFSSWIGGDVRIAARGAAKQPRRLGNGNLER
jgi:hypothetical protein